jgi:membrane protein DedA with SNARE-associated domain
VPESSQHTDSRPEEGQNAMDVQQAAAAPIGGALDEDTENQAAAAPAGLWRKYGPRFIALGASLVITISVITFRQQIVDLGRYGYLGVFVISLLGNATVILPVPSLAVVFAGGGVLNPIVVGLVAGVAEPLGELTGYLAGYGGSAIIEDRVRYERIKGWMERRGFLTLFVFSVIPNPLFDLAGMTAGMLKFPVWRFLVACWLGKTIKALVIAYVGSVSVGLLEGLLGGFGL